MIQMRRYGYLKWGAVQYAAPYKLCHGLTGTLPFSFLHVALPNESLWLRLFSNCSNAVHISISPLLSIAFSISNLLFVITLIIALTSGSLDATRCSKFINLLQDTKVQLGSSQRLYV